MRVRGEIVIEQDVLIEYDHYVFDGRCRVRVIITMASQRDQILGLGNGFGAASTSATEHAK